ncbi:MAG: ferredoxin, partial [Kiloniellaceae bacterium]
DARYARYCEPIPRDNWRDDMILAADYAKLAPERSVEHSACIMTVDADNALYRTVVDDKLIDASRHCADAWWRLQELGGVNNSYANRLLERERAAWEEQKARELAALREAAPPAPAPEAAPPAEAPAAPLPAAAAEPSEAEEPEPANLDEAWIETARCTTCNECTQINDKMFAYNDNMQAYIADLEAGTYGQMVEAAESCQVSIIHPGLPRDPSEPNLDDLIERAEPFI